MEDKDKNEENSNYDSGKIEKEDAIDDHSIVGDNVMDIYEIAINRLWKKAQEIDRHDITNESIDEIYKLIQVTRYTFNAAKEVIEFSEDSETYFNVDMTDDDFDDDDEFSEEDDD